MDLMETKGKLYKSQQDKALFGVCGGIAEYFNVDSLVVRLLFVLFTLVYGAGLLFYLVAALLIPSAPVSAGVRQTVQPVAEPSVENGDPQQPASYVAADGTPYENRASETISSERSPETLPEVRSTSAPGNGTPEQPAPPKNRGSATTLGLALVVVGGLILVKVFFPWVDGRAVVGAGMILAGLFFIVKKA